MTSKTTSNFRKAKFWKIPAMRKFVLNKINEKRQKVKLEQRKKARQELLKNYPEFKEIFDRLPLE